MMWLLSLLGIGKNVMSWLTGAVGWLFQRWYRIAIAALLMVGVYLFMANVSLRKQLDRMTVRYTTEATAHITTKVGYANAQKVAADMNAKQVERIENEYAAIAERTESEYETRLADNRANLNRWLRAKTTASSPDSAGTGSAATMPSEALPDATEAVVSVSDLEIAADNYAQLVSLIEWAESVGKVDTAAQ